MIVRTNTLISGTIPCHVELPKIQGAISLSDSWKVLFGWHKVDVDHFASLFHSLRSLLWSAAHAKLIFSKEVTILDAVVAVLLMEASLNGCGKLLDKINALHTTFAPQPEKEYEEHGNVRFLLR